MGYFNLKTTTLGGKQLWADVQVLPPWRIQQQVLSGHYRLLDEKNVRHAWGTFEACQHKLAAICREQRLEPPRGEVVLILHGLFRTRGAMRPLAEYLEQQGGLTVVNVGYPTTRGTIAEHAARLDRVIGHLEHVDTLHFVAHSLGNLVVRQWLHDYQQRERPVKVGRMVMLAPPNHRPVLARKLAPFDITHQIGGHALQQLAHDWESIAPGLATPDFDFGILAGGRGNLAGYNPLVPGDDDLVVSVASTKLAGARDFRRVASVHTFLMNQKQVQEYTLRFLQHGHFEDNASRTPILP